MSPAGPHVHASGRQSILSTVRRSHADLMQCQRMSCRMPAIRQRTHELKLRIRESAAGGGASARKRKILIAEPGPPTWPERVLRDPVLEPVDKTVWMVLRQSAIRGRFPSYRRIGQAANISSKSTVSRAIVILRATRWLARCMESRTRGAGRRMSRATRPGAEVAVFALHDAPLPVPDTLHLDTGYLAFLQFSQAHPHARVRKVVWDILAPLSSSALLAEDRVRRA